MKRRASSLSGSSSACPALWQLGVGESPPHLGGLAQQRRFAFLDAVPGVRERVGRAPHARGDPLVNAEASGIGGEGDAGQLPGSPVERRGREPRVARVGSGEDGEGEPQVGRRGAPSGLWP